MIEELKKMVETHILDMNENELKYLYETMTEVKSYKNKIKTLLLDMDEKEMDYTYRYILELKKNRIISY